VVVLAVASPELLPPTHNTNTRDVLNAVYRGIVLPIAIIAGRRLRVIYNMILWRTSSQSQHNATACIIGHGKHDTETRGSYV